ncbi:glycosyltransferase [Clostridium perfringens]|uniref:glycosyltransferase n=1 Tax=Clostridium perfringens TaxID=1502 RepID=UPI0023F74D49|nr:glycosyltransferase [Clostridium perfringens]WEV19601.1 glycosyltransferase [Clostridium perfringens D]
MNKLRVCHIVCGLKAGGVESIIYNYCSNIDNSKYEWHILYQHTPNEKNVQEFKKIGFNMKQIVSKIKNPILNYYETYKYLKDNKIDVVHTHMTLMNFIPLIAAKQLNIKIRISHSHNCFTNENILKKIFAKFCRVLIKKNATHLVACGLDAGKYLYENDEFIILNNALDLKKFSFNKNYRNKIRSQYNIKSDDFLIGHIGRFTIQKNHDFIISLFNKISVENPNVKLMLIGEGENYDKVLKEVSKIKNKENIIFTGVINNINEYYSAFDIFILPSLWEGLPVVGLEAQASGVKCLFSSNIDSNVVISKELCTIIDLNLEKWTKEIVNYKKKKNFFRDIDKDAFINKGLDINYELSKLENIYNSKK